MLKSYKLFSEKNHPELKNFDYLLGMSMWMLTEERKNELLRQKDNKMTELNILKKKTNGDLYREDLDVFIEELDKVEKKELAEIDAEMKKEKQPGVSYYCNVKLKHS